MDKLTHEELAEIIQPIVSYKTAFNVDFLRIEDWLAREAEEQACGIDLSPDFQRGHVWSEKQQIHFMENVFRGIVDKSGLTIRFNCPKWQNEQASDSDLLDQIVCVDGLQRLTAIRRFMAGEIKAFGLTKDNFPRAYFTVRNSLSCQMYEFQYRKDLLKFYLDINGGGIAHTEAELARVRELLDGV